MCECVRNVVKKSCTSFCYYSNIIFCSYTHNVFRPDFRQVIRSYILLFLDVSQTSICRQGWDILSRDLQKVLQSETLLFDVTVNKHLQHDIMLILSDICY